MSPILIVFCPFSDNVSPSLVSSTTFGSNKRIYPRGIINPNYPGFQHFAHTLSEHFIEHQNTNVQSGNMSDSDASEVDCDMKIESAKVPANMLDFTDDGIACDPNGNSIVDTTADIEREDNLNKVAEILRTVFESNSSHLLSAIETLTERESSDIDNSCDAIDDNSKMTECIIQCDDFDIMVDSPPPDILQKSSSSESGFESCADKPDILLNVTDEPDCVHATLLTVEKEESNSVTPVDIVGNFEQEVQREIGLLVTRYKNNKKGDAGGVKVDASFASEKMYNKVKIP